MPNTQIKPCNLANAPKDPKKGAELSIDHGYNLLPRIYVYIMHYTYLQLATRGL